MTKKLKQQALLKHRIVLQAAFCVEDLLLAAETNGGRPWIAVVAEHMEALFPKPGKLKPKKEIVYGLNPYS
jgi:Holliday junction resolvase